jgi:hypothetical protein
MPPLSPYQRILISGVPCWKDATGNLYYYETATPPTEQSRILIGSEATGLNPDWVNRLEPMMRSYRATQKSRARAPPKS